MFNKLKKLLPFSVAKKKPKEIFPEILVLAPNSELKSAGKLGYKTDSYFMGHKEDADNKVIIRYGYGFDVPSKDKIFCDSPDFKHVINPVESIKQNVIKNKQLEVLSKIVNTPKIYTGKVPKRKMVVFRPTSHAAGSGFQLRQGPFEIPKGYYATEFIKTDKEIRVFVCGNRTMTCSREKGKLTDSDICRSMWAYRRFRRTPKQLHKTALKAAKKLNLDCCAFDILVKGRKYFFLESNTAPTIESDVRKFYQDGLKVLIKKKFPHLVKKNK